MFWWWWGGVLDVNQIVDVVLFQLFAKVIFALFKNVINQKVENTIPMLRGRQRVEKIFQTRDCVAMLLCL